MTRPSENSDLLWEVVAECSDLAAKQNPQLLGTLIPEVAKDINRSWIKKERPLYSIIAAVAVILGSLCDEWINPENDDDEED